MTGVQILPAQLRLRIAHRDNFRCHICGQGYIAGEAWEIDHDQALAKGGTWHVRNLKLAHARCNREKGSA